MVHQTVAGSHRIRTGLCNYATLENGVGDAFGSTITLPCHAFDPSTVPQDVYQLLVDKCNSLQETAHYRIGLFEAIREKSGLRNVNTHETESRWFMPLHHSQPNVEEEQETDTQH